MVVQLVAWKELLSAGEKAARKVVHWAEQWAASLGLRLAEMLVDSLVVMKVA